MHATPTVAVIDVGSNSIKLLVARRGSGGPSAVEAVFAETVETRISTGIGGELPSLSDSAIEAGAATIDDLARLARGYRPRAIRAVATSAVRDALNGRDFVRRVWERSALEVEILDGDREARLIGKGLSGDPALAGIPRFIQLDLGGGSLELIRFRDLAIENAVSLRLGAVRLTERFVTDSEAGIPGPTEEAIRDHVRATVAESGFDFTPADRPLIVTGGAFVVVRAILAAEAGQSLEAFPPEISRERIAALREKLTALTLHERMAVPHLPAARADVIPTGLITVETLLALAERDRVVHSFHNLRYGVAAEMLEAAGL